MDGDGEKNKIIAFDISDDNNNMKLILAITNHIGNDNNQIKIIHSFNRQLDIGPYWNWYSGEVLKFYYFKLVYLLFIVKFMKFEFNR